MKYDDASWHYGGDFPAHLPEHAGGTHIGMFVAFMLLNGFAGTIHTVDFADALRQLTRRENTPGDWFMNNCDGKFTAEDLNEEGNAFTKAYYVYSDEDGELRRAVNYIQDYEAIFTDSKWLYDVEDSWDSFSRLETLLASRLAEWRAERGKGA